MKRVALIIFTFAVLLTKIQAQAVHEVLSALQDRKLMLAQRDTVYAELKRASETASGGTATTPEDPMESSDLIQWKHLSEPFPTAGNIQQLTMPHLIELLNQAVREADSLKKRYYNVNPVNAEKLYFNTVPPTLESLPSVGMVDATNVHGKLRELAQLVDRMKVLGWPVEYASSSGSYSLYEALTAATPGWSLEMPFISATLQDATYATYGSHGVMYPGTSFSVYYAGTGAQGSAFIGVESQGNIGGVGGLASRIAPSTSGEAPKVISGGNLYVYKRMTGSNYFLEEVITDYEKMPMVNWKLMHLGSEVLDVGVMEVAANNSAAEFNDVSAIKSGLETFWDVQISGWSGSWVTGNDPQFTLWYQFDEHPTDKFVPNTAEAGVLATVICVPNFTPISGLAKAELSSLTAAVPGDVSMEVDSQLLRIELGRGLTNKGESAALGSRVDGFGSPLFIGAMSAYKILYESNPENYPACLVSERFGFPRGTEFTQQEKDDTGWSSKKEYIRAWYEPRLRQVYGSDVVVDIEYVHDYCKILHFYWASGQTIPQTNSPAELTGEPFKSITVKNGTVSEDAEFPTSNKILRLMDSGTLHWEVSKTGHVSTNTAGQSYLIKKGSSAGASDLMSRSIQINSDTSVTETVSEPGRQSTTVVQYYESNGKIFNRFSGFASPVSIQEGGRTIQMAYSNYDAPLGTNGQPVTDLAYRPILNSMTFGGDDSWRMNGAILAWSSDGVIRSEKTRAEGKWWLVENEWDEWACVSVSKLDEVAYRTEVATYGADLLSLSQSVDGGPSVTHAYADASSECPYHLKKIVSPGGHQTTVTVTRPSNQTIIRIQQGWGNSHSNGVDTFLAYNASGGFVSRVVSTTNLANPVLLDSVTGSEETPWGDPKLLTGLRGAQSSVTYNQTGRAWGLPTAWTNSRGVSGAVTGYDPLLRPTGADDGFSQYVPDYSNALQSKVSITGQGTVTVGRTASGEVSSFNDTRPGGLQADLTPGSGFLKVDGRQVGIKLSETRELLGKDSGLGSRGVQGEWSVVGGRLCRTTRQLNAGNTEHAMVQTFYDGLGRVIKVSSPGPLGALVSETWEYDDALRKVRYYPVPGPQSKNVVQTLSQDGGTLEIVEEAGVQIKYVRSVENEPGGNGRRLVVTTMLLDDSAENGGWRQLSKVTQNPATGESRSIPWDLNAATSTTSAPSVSQNMTISSTSGHGGSQLVTTKNGLPKRVEGKSGGVEYDLNQWTFENGKLTNVSGTIGGIDVGMQWDDQGRLSRRWGQGSDQTYGYGEGPGFEVTIDDSVQNTLRVLRTNSIGDLTEWTGDVAHEISAVTRDLPGSQRSVTINDRLTVKQAGDGSLLRKDYAGGLVENRTYDTNGLLKSFGTGPEAATTTYSAGDRKTTQYAGGVSVVEDFYSVGLRKSVEGPSDSRTFKYLHGLLRKETHNFGWWQGWNLTRTQDDKGRVQKSELKRAAESVETTFSYDTHGRVSGAGPATYQYDSKGRLFKCIRAPLTTTWTYDALGRVGDVHTANTQGPDVNSDHGYNPRNLRVTRTSTGGQSWTGMTYDRNGRLTRATLTNGSVLNYNYDSDGNRADGAGSITYTINGLDQVTGRELGQRGYGVQGIVDPGSQIRVFHPLAPLGESITVDAVTGVYKAFWTVTSNWDGGGVSRVEMLVRGTIVGAGAGGTDAVADKQVWAVVPASEEVFAYDGAGRMVGDSNWVYGWDGMGHLITMARKAGASQEPNLSSESLSFQYDSDGRRVHKLRIRTYLNQPPKIEESRLLWDGWLPAVEDRIVNGLALPRRKFSWGLDVSGTLDGAGGIGGLLAIHEEGGRTLLPVDDGLGNIVRVIDQATGNTVAKYDYAPYGELVEQWGELDACPFRYQSKYFDGETGLSYFGFRYYSAKLGRWISRDPLGEAGGFNLYGYCGNDPVNGWDLLGGEPRLHRVKGADGQDILAESARILGGIPQVRYSESNGLFGWWTGEHRSWWQAPSQNELERLFAQDSTGWRLASLSERHETWERQLKNSMQKSAPDVRETLGYLNKAGAVGAVAPLALASIPSLYTGAQLYVGRGTLWWLNGGSVSTAMWGTRLATASGSGVALSRLVRGDGPFEAMSNGAETFFNIASITGIGNPRLALPRFNGNQIFRRTEIQLKLAEVLDPKFAKNIDPNALVGYRGSLARGSKHEGKGGGGFDSEDFDLDLFIMSDKLAAAWQGKVRERWGTKFEEIRDVQSRLGALFRTYPEFKGMREGRVRFRIFTSEEIEKHRSNGDSQVFILE